MNESLLSSQADLFEEDKDWLNELIGEGKKYKDQAAAAKALAHSQYHISNIEKENSELRKDNLTLRSENTAGTKWQDLMTKLESKLSSSDNQANDEPKIQQPPDLDSFFDKKYEEVQARQKRTENFNKVKEKLQESYKDRSSDFLRQKLQELGTNPESFDELARTNPTLAINALGLNSQPQETYQTPPTSRERFTPKGPEKRTWTWWEDKRKKSPGKMLSASDMKQMEEDYRRFGKDFEDGDYTRFRPTYDLI